MQIFDITDYGAKSDSRRCETAAIQAAVDACGHQGGGVVYVPPGNWLSGTIELASNVRFHVESGAVIRASREKNDFEPLALFHAVDAQNITLEGRGTIDGQSEYEWRLNDHQDDFIRDNMELAESVGHPLERAFPVDAATPKMVFCISNCTIDTGDDALVFYSMDWNGPATPCENITVTNCAIECRRHDWFWWGDGEPFHFNIKRRSEVHKNHVFENEPPAGSISNVKIMNIIARGEGACSINGHRNSRLSKIVFENVSIHLAPNPAAPYTKGEEAIRFEWIDDMAFHNVHLSTSEAGVAG